MTSSRKRSASTMRAVAPTTSCISPSPTTRPRPGASGATGAATGSSSTRASSATGGSLRTTSVRTASLERARASSRRSGPSRTSGESCCRTSGRMRGRRRVASGCCARFARSSSRSSSSTRASRRPGRSPDLETDGVRLWRLPPDGIAEAFADRQLLIADGHHRYETALAYHQEAGTPESAYVLAVLVSLEDPGLMIFPTHRVFAREPSQLLATDERLPNAERALAALGELPRDRAAAVVYRAGDAELAVDGEGELDVRLVVCRAAAEDVRGVLRDLPTRTEREPVVGDGVGGDETTAVDAAAEHVILERLRAIDGATIVSEEVGVLAGDGSLRVVVDPIDGSLNAKRGIPFFSLSVAVAEGETMDDVVFGYVHDFGTGEEWTAERGAGARLNGEPPGELRPTRAVDIAAAQLLVTERGLAIDLPEAPPFAEAPLDIEGRSRVVAAATPEVCDALFAALSR